MTPSRPAADVDDARFQDTRFPDASRRPLTAGPRTRTEARAGAKRTLLDTFRQIPNYLRLLGGLLIDRRVSLLDKALVAGAIAYIVSPLDLIPDFIPFLGEVDDIFLLMTALERLVSHAGEDVILDHWHGDPDEIAALNLKEVVGAATMFLPGGIKTRLVRMVRSRGRSAEA